MPQHNDQWKTYLGETIVCLSLCISQSIEHIGLSIASIGCDIRHSILSVHYEKQHKHIALISAYKQTIIIIIITTMNM